LDAAVIGAVGDGGQGGRAGFKAIGLVWSKLFDGRLGWVVFLDFLDAVSAIC